MLWPILLSLIVIIAPTAYELLRKPSIHRHGDKLGYGPGTLPMLGNALKFLQPRHLLFEWFIQCQRKFGFETFTISIPSLPSGVVVNDPKTLEYVLRNESTITKGEFFRRRSWDLFGHGIINSDGELWKTQRKAGLKFFTGANLDTLIEDVLPKAYMQTRSTLLQCAKSGQPLDLEALLLDLTTAVVGRMAYDMDISASSPFSRCFDYASDQTGRRFQNPLYSVTELFTGSKFRSSLAEVKKFGQQIVWNANDRRNERERAHQTSNTGFGSLVDSLMDVFDEDPVLTADAALNFLSAGRDTTAQSLTWTFYSLMRHPSALATLREEINSTFPAPPSSTDNSTKAQPSTPLLELSVASLQPTNLPLTASIFNESLRLHPPVPFEIKQCQVDTQLPDFTFLPKGSIIVWCIWAINRSQQIWGEDAECFRPERWLEGVSATATNGGRDKGVKLITKSPFEFPVFNGGPRSCLGKKMAELMACWVLLQIWRDFDFEEIFDDAKQNGKREERRSQNSLTLPMEGGLPCHVRLRRDEGPEEASCAGR